jgi:hypothetical protein
MSGHRGLPRLWNQIRARVREKFEWTDWRGSFDGRPSMYIKTIVAAFGRKVELHKFVRADDPACFHTHPARAIRIILWNGYVEELENGVRQVWLAGDVGLVRPELCHRVATVLGGRPAYTLWLRGRKRAETQIRGAGWPAERRSA